MCAAIQSRAKQQQNGVNCKCQLQSQVLEVGGVPALYPMDESSQGHLFCLDNNHTHFILVDDGTHGRYGVEIPLRTQLEKFISEQNMYMKDIKIPTVCVVLGGGPGTLDTIYSSMRNNTPCVIVEGSGGMADVIAQVAQVAQEAKKAQVAQQAQEALLPPFQITNKLIRKKLKRLFQDSYDSVTDSQISEWTEKPKPAHNHTQKKLYAKRVSVEHI